MKKFISEDHTGSSLRANWMEDFAAWRAGRGGEVSWSVKVCLGLCGQEGPCLSLELSTLC